MADRFNWLWWHVPAPMVAAGKDWRPYKKAAGLPDLVLISDDPPRIVFAEIKGDGGKLSEAQVEFLKAARDVADSIRHAYHDLVCAGANAPRPQDPVGVFVWTPDQADLVEQILRTRVLV
jgi:hypothetical protein